MSNINTEQNQEPKFVNQRDARYWTSLDELQKTPEYQKFVESEFQSSPIREGLSDEDMDKGWARRDFLKLMGASLAMSAAGCIKRPVQKIVPYNKQPEEVTHEVANYYTSSYFDGNESIGLLVKTLEGRPVRVEGNPQHPLNKGALNIKAQASILGLYDPERLKGPRQNLLNKEKTNSDSIAATWENIDDVVVKQLAKGQVAVLTGNIASPSLSAVVSDFSQAFKARHYQYEALSYEDIQQGQKLSYGDSIVPFYRFDEAKVIVSFDADFLGSWLAPTTFTKQFSSARKNPKTMNKLVAFDSHYSLTGANADIRVKLKPSQQLQAALGLAHELIIKKSTGKHAGDDRVKSALSPHSESLRNLGIDPNLVARLVDDLIKNKGRSLVVAGSAMGGETATQLQIVVNLINSTLENEGATVIAKSRFTAYKSSSADMADLITDMKNGKINTLIIHGTNPSYFLNDSTLFQEAATKVGMILYTGDKKDETGKMANYIIPDNHPLESWGDNEAVAGLYTIHQPTIRPMYDTRSFALSLMTWAFMAKVGSARLTGPETYYDFVRAFWKTDVLPKVGGGKSFEDFWQTALQEGFVGEVASQNSARSFNSAALAGFKEVNQQGFELVMYAAPHIGDGKYTNVSWLHELPDPVTKIVWDNFAQISMAAANKMSLKTGDMVEITVGDKKIEIPVHIQPGLHNETIAIAIGYGRKNAGKITTNVGMNIYHLAQWSDKALVNANGQLVTVRKTGHHYDLAKTQDHSSMNGRQIVNEATLVEYEKNEAANLHKHHIWSIWSGHQYNGHKWGMAVDLNSCTGCSNCMIACQSENNIPVVGKKYVMQGREMYWIRVDRYYVGDGENAEAVFQPVMCQHCDNAPCETVCPVIATSHSAEGLNDMTYNRCVGTRYCSNNCPYKVRRFNWFNFNKDIEKPLHLAMNPEVTVRPRGVMEKCTFCVHKIKAGKNQAKLEGRELKDGDIKTACQTSCPADAITFGDMNDPESKVSKIFKTEPRAYALLEEFHAAPSVRYLTKIRNNDQEKRFSDSSGGHA